MQTDPRTAFAIEMRALRFGMYAALAMAAVGIGFAYAANSQAILFDGLFNVLLFVMVAMSRTVARDINRGPDEQYHFGYGGYEPFLVLMRSAIAIALMVYSSFLAVQTILRGGAEVQGALALAYSVIMATACGGTALYMRRAYVQTRWPTMEAEFITWVLNGAISSAAGVALFAAGLLRGTSAEWLVPYADPIVLLAMQVMLVPAPFRMLLTSILELVGKAPVRKLESQAALEGLLPEGFTVRVARAVKQGRTEFIALEIATDPATTVGRCDEIRARWSALARQRYPNTCATVLFTSPGPPQA